MSPEASTERDRALAGRIEDRPNGVLIASTLLRSSSSTSETRCSICHEPLGNRAEIKPCDHEFDLECLSTWLAQLGPASKKCPLCRGDIERIHHSFNDRGTFITQVIGSAEEEDEEGDGDNDNADDEEEEVEEVEGEEEEVDELENDEVDMTERERHAALEHRRLRAMDPLDLHGHTQYLNIGIIDGEHYIIVKRSIKLDLMQCERSLTTRVQLGRTVHIRYQYQGGLNVSHEWDNSPRNLLEVGKAQREVEGMLNRWLDADLGVKEANFTLHEVEIEKAQRGISSKLTSTVGIKCTAEDPKDVSIYWNTYLEETGPAHADNDFDHTISDPQYETRSRRAEHIRNVVEQIQSTVEWFHSRVGTGSRWREIDRRTTNILEPCGSPARCKYCRNEHRNGDCLLPWEHVRIGVEDRPPPNSWTDNQGDSSESS